MAKSSLFLSAGLVKDRLGTDRIEAMTDQGGRMPIVTMAVAVAGVSLAGLPITLGFAGKWQLLLAAVDTGRWWVAAVAVAGTLVAATYLLRPVQTLLPGESSEERPGHTGGGVRSAPRAATLVPLTAALLATLAIVASGPLADLAVLGMCPGGTS